MYTTLFLSELREGQTATIVSAKTDMGQMQRFYDLGLVPGTKIKKIFSSPSGTPAAYEVIGTVLALRREDAAKISVTLC